MKNWEAAEEDWAESRKEELDFHIWLIGNTKRLRAYTIIVLAVVSVFCQELITPIDYATSFMLIGLLTLQYLLSCSHGSGPMQMELAAHLFFFTSSLLSVMANLQVYMAPIENVRARLQTLRGS